MLAHLLLAAALQPSPASAAPASPEPAASAAPTVAVEDPSITKLVREQFDAFVAGKIDTSQYSVPIPAASLAQAHAGLAALGAVKSVRFVESRPISGSMVYAYKFVCANGAVYEQLSVKDGKIDGIYFAPAQ